MQVLRRFEQVVREIRKIDPSMPMQHLHFLLVVQREMANGGVSYPDLEKELDTTRATVSRITRYLGIYMVKDGKGGHHNKGKGWVEAKPDAYQPKFLNVTLTDEGAKFCNLIESKLSK